MYFDDIKQGYEFDIPPVVIDKQQMLDFAKLYDNIPLHTDEKFAKTTHFGGLIAPGMMSFLVVWAKYLEVDIFGDELIAGKSTKVEWFKPVFPEDVLTGRCTVTGVTPRNARNGLAEITINVTNQDGVTVLSAVTEAVVKRRTSEQV